ncbi:FAD-dependent oxidoreductase [Nonomuraea sp. K274]|uniref:FAD-dependent oxidoreductase n=1 Tax=Nonomuraea cypriaca TaxID=1187855 RepID=A0A931A5C3_9ACTN|nr:FAD-dependent oxidoreductase [Nonomuraea cypriaca]MBF8185428.1 FAD-dependent oxidoreductase [Nonomuraea cypriaca]
MTNHIVVLGAGYAGLGAAKRAARRLRRTDARVTLVNASDRFVERVRLHQLAAGQRLPRLPLAGLLDGTGVELVLARVIGLDPRARTVRLDAPPYTLSYDALVYALGSAAELDAVPGVREHAYTVATADEAARLRSRLAETGSVDVVGGGLTGIEAATEFAAARPSLRVRLVSSGLIGAGLSVRARRHLHRAFARMGIAVREHAPVAKTGPDGLLLENGEDLRTETVVWAAGFRVPGLAATAGLATDEHGRMIVDGALRSVSHPEVFGIGDAATADRSGRPTRMACQTGLPMGLYAGEAVADLLTGREPRPARFRYVWQNISLGRHDGVTQFTRPDDTPTDAVLTGRASAAFKEAITRGTVWVMRHPGPWSSRP